MNTYMDIEGATCQALQAEAPTLLNTTQGELCADVGQWVVYPTPNARPTIIDAATFAASFTRIDQ